MTGPGAERTGLSTRHQGARMLSFKDIRMFKTGPGFHGIYTVGTSLECCSFQRGTRIMRWKHAPHSSSPKWAERGVHRSFFKAQTAIFNSCVRVCVCACVCTYLYFHIRVLQGMILRVCSRCHGPLFLHHRIHEPQATRGCLN